MRVGYLFNHAHIVGGGEISFLELMEGVRNLGIEVIPFVPGPGVIEDRLRAAEFTPHRVAMPSLRGPGLLLFPWLTRRLAATLLRTGCELIHANGARCALYAVTAARRLPIPAVWHVRVIDRDGRLDQLRGKRCSAVIANSRAVADTLRPLLPPRRRLEIIPNGIDIPKVLSALRHDLCREFGLPPLPVILAVGRVSPEKGYDVLIQASGRLRARGREHAVVVVGARPNQAYQHKLDMQIAAITGLKWVWAGESNAVYSLIKGASILALPSLHEGFGRVILEAWACGTPVVATRQGGPAELIRDGQNGLLAEPGDPDALARALDRLLNDPTLARGLIEKGGVSVKGFALQTTAQRAIQLYQAVQTDKARGTMA